jgi:regulator of replication initiation timing
LRISRVISEIEDKISDLRDNLKAVKEWVRYLEEENQNLRRELCSYSSRSEQFGSEGSVNSSLEEGNQRLRSLYQEGFHICPYNFGQWRTEDCLFCLGFLRNSGKEQE